MWKELKCTGGFAVDSVQKNFPISVQMIKPRYFEAMTHLQEC